jgi:protein-tyrosine phosphatase
MKNILFVCLGNTCRSPMAELLARHFFSGADFHFESAGIEAKTDTPIAFFAAETLAIHHFIEAENFRSRHISTVDLATMSLIIALDKKAAIFLEKEKKEQTKLLFWDIKDPFGEDLAAYTVCMENIFGKIAETGILNSEK